MKASSVSLTIIIFLIFTSCTSPRYLDVQVLNPAEVKLPQNIEKFFIVSNKLISETTKNTDTLYLFFLKNFYDKLNITLSQSPLFSDCKLYVCNPDSFRQIFTKSSYAERKRYATFSIDSIALLDSIQYMNGENNYSPPNLKLELKFSIVGRFWKFSSPENFIAVRQKDTLFWEFSDLYEFQNQMPNNFIAYSEGGKAIGEIFAQKMAPYWITQERILFHNPNRYMRKAYGAYVKDNLTVAIEHWERVYNLGTKPLASLAAHNVAVCYEMRDDLDLCEEWLSKSIVTRPNSITQNYLLEIKKRRSNLILLNKQMLLP